MPDLHRTANKIGIEERAVEQVGAILGRLFLGFYFVEFAGNIKMFFAFFGATGNDTFPENLRHQAIGAGFSHDRNGNIFGQLFLGLH